MEDLVSVIVPIYNSDRFLERTICHIANQTYRNLEIILVDDGSTDTSGQICDAFAEKDDRCKVIHKPHEGQGSARNAGQKIASGDFLFFPDSDDLFHLDMIQILHEAITKDPTYDLAISDMEVVKGEDSDTTFLAYSVEDVPIEEYSRDDLIRRLFSKYDDRFVYGWNKLYRKELPTDIWCENYPRHQDFDFNFRVFLKARKAVFVNLKLYFWVKWSGSKTHQSNTWGLYYRSRTAILFNNWKILPREDNRYEHYLLDALYRAMVFWEEWCRKSGDFEEVKAICDDYQKETRHPYVKTREISLLRKAFCLTMLSFPNLSHLVMVLTSNAR